VTGEDQDATGIEQSVSLVNRWVIVYASLLKRDLSSVLQKADGFHQQV
jgi:hypothetical protein